jgi:hypothetical protein
MTTVTIPKKMAEMGDLVIIPRQEYNALLKRRKVVPVIKLTASEKRSLDRARREMNRGEFITLEELEHELASTYREKRAKKS